MEEFKKLLTPEIIQKLADPAQRQKIAQELAGQYPAPPGDIDPSSFAEGGDFIGAQGGPAAPQPLGPPGPQLQAPQPPQLPNPLAGIGKGISNFGGFGAPPGIDPNVRRG